MDPANGKVLSLYPEIALGTFGFPTDAHIYICLLSMSLFGLGRPKWPYLEPKMLYLGLKSSFRQKGFEP